HRDEEPAADRDAPPRQRTPRPDDDGVRPRLRAHRVERLRCRDTEPAPLPGGEPPVAVVPAELVARLVDDRAVGGGQPPAAEERAVIVAGEEARLLAVGAPRDREARGRRLAPPLPLHLLAAREPD